MALIEKPADRLPKILLVAGVVVLLLVVLGWLGYAKWNERKRAVGEEPAAEAAQAPVDDGPQDQWIEWSAADARSDYKIADLDIRLETSQQDGFAAPLIKVTSADGRTIQVRGADGSTPARASFAVVQMNAADPARQVLFASFSYGAHCCTQVYLLEQGDKGWRVVDLGAWDGEGIDLPTDVDGDGIKEIVGLDQSFLYAFSSYAESLPPMAIFAVRNGKMENVSADRKYRSFFERRLPEMKQACERGGNGPCAGYAGTAARAGQLEAAWPVVLNNIRNEDWSYPGPCRDGRSSGCGVDQMSSYDNYAEALQWFLGAEGYTAPMYTRLANPDGPSFSCAAGRTRVERLICDNGDLRYVDAQMAEAYTRAHALSRNWAALRADQNRFLRERDAISDPKLMLQAYLDRITELERD